MEADGEIRRSDPAGTIFFRRPERTSRLAWRYFSGVPMSSQ